MDDSAGERDNDLRVLICGGRYYDDAPEFEIWMMQIVNYASANNLKIHVIHGAASGADTMAQVFADRNQLQFTKFPADWNRYGPAAGPIRNRQMLLEGRPHVVLAFPGNRGTADMIKIAHKATGVTVIDVAEQKRLAYDYVNGISDRDLRGSDENRHTPLF